MHSLPLRLPPGADLRRAVEAAVVEYGVSAAFVLSGIGSLGPALLRFAGAPEATRIDGDSEILTLAGTVSAGGAHLHASLSRADGSVVGGHVAHGCTVRTTVELLLVLLPEWHFSRAPDPATGFDELLIKRMAPPAA